MSVRVACGRLALLTPMLLAAGMAPPGQGTVIAERTLASHDGATISLDTDHGGLTVRGEARDTVTITVTAQGVDPDEAERLLDLTVTETSDGASIRGRYNKKDGWLSGWLGGGGGGVHYDVRVPTRTNLKIANGSGGVDVAATEGTIRLDNGSGGVRIEEITGDVSLENGSGGVRLSRLRGDLTVGNGSGGIDATDVTGKVRVENGSGGVDLEDIDGALSVETASGGVRARMTGENAGIDATAGSGGVRIVVPAGWSANLDLKTGSGRVTLEGWPDADVGSARSFRAQVGGGGPRIHIESSSGDVELIAR